MIKATVLLYLITIGITSGFMPVQDKHGSLVLLHASAGHHEHKQKKPSNIHQGTPKKEKQQKKKVFGTMMRNLEDEPHIQSSLVGTTPSSASNQDLDNHETLSNLDNYYRLP